MDFKFPTGFLRTLGTELQDHEKTVRRIGKAYVATAAALGTLCGMVADSALEGVAAGITGGSALVGLVVYPFQRLQGRVAIPVVTAGISTAISTAELMVSGDPSDLFICATVVGGTEAAVGAKKAFNWAIERGKSLGEPTDT